MSVQLAALQSFWANPVVTRDLRVRLRGARAYWNQAAYLLVLGLIVLVGYGTASSADYYRGSPSFDPVMIQAKLHEFYNYIFIALSALISLIAPALTAATITTERQSLTLDLLITTPLTAAQLLYGKLVSSVAFITLLLVLSLPASALCVMLGGATLGDIFRIYVIICIDGLVIAAIGLYFSCAVRQSLAAILWTYLAVIAYYIACLGGETGLGLSGLRGGGIAPFACYGMLNPFDAVADGNKSFALGGMNVPLFIGVAFLAILIIRLLVTASAYRLGAHGPGLVGSLRRQALFFTALTVFAGAHCSYGVVAPYYLATHLIYLVGVGFGGSLLFLPGLFTPATPEDAPPGTVVTGWYHPMAAFRADHAGSLPFFHVWLLVLLASCLAGLRLQAGSAAGIGSLTFWLWTAYWLSGLGFLAWALCRWSASIVKTLSSARAMAFGLLAVAAAVPLAVIAIMDTDGSAIELNPVGNFWILSPLLHPKPADCWGFMLWAGSLCYGVGVLMSPFWRSVIPGGRNRMRKVNAEPV